MQAVTIVVTGNRKGKSLVGPYSHAEGLQVAGNNYVAYEVPTYEVGIINGHSYEAIRFGLTNNHSTSQTRTCDTGICKAHTCIPTWHPTFRTSNVTGTRAGAFVLFPNRGFLLHEGGDSTRNELGGALGCIEILNGRWMKFLADVEKIGGKPISTLVAAKRVKIDIRPASFPEAKFYGLLPKK